MKFEPHELRVGTWHDGWNKFAELTEVPTVEEPYAEDIQCVGIRPTSSFTFEMNLTARTYKILNRLAKRGNNWRRLHGKSLIRVPLRERRKRK